MTACCFHRSQVAALTIPTALYKFSNLEGGQGCHTIRMCAQDVIQCVGTTTNSKIHIPAVSSIEDNTGV